MTDDEPSSSSAETEPQKTDIHVDLGSLYWHQLNELAETHYGGNRTNVLRRGINLVNAQHEEGGGQHRVDDALKMQITEMEAMLETIREAVAEIAREQKTEVQSSQLPFETRGEEVGRAAEEIYKVLGNADRPLSIDGILEQTGIGIAVLGGGIELLDDKEMIQKVENEQGPRYRLMPIE